MNLGGEFDFFKIYLDTASLGAAYSLKLAGKEHIKNGYGDYIFFNLIPACIGGAITQNAGTKSDGEIKDVCTGVRLFDILKQCKVKKNDFLKKIKDQKIKDKLKKLTQEAYDKDIFGAPTFIVNEIIFWGQDRLVYAIDELFNKN